MKNTTQKNVRALVLVVIAFSTPILEATSQSASMTTSSSSSFATTDKCPNTDTPVSTQFNATDCYEDSGNTKFTADTATGLTVFEGTRACKAAEGPWLKCCKAKGMILEATPPKTPQDMTFTIIDCRARRPANNMWVTCGNFKCVPL